MRRQTSIILAITLAIGVLAGCAQAAATQPPSVAVAPTPTPPPPTATAAPVAATAEPTKPAAEPAAAAWQPVVGAQVSDFELLGVDGVTHKLSDYVGQGMILNFWATWCPHCKSEVPVFQEVYEARAAEGFVIVAVSVGELPETVKQFVQDSGMTFPVLLDPTGEAAGVYQVGGIPASYFVDRTGVIRGNHVGAITDAAALNGVVDALLK
jgi:peroxiredoxin